MWKLLEDIDGTTRKDNKETRRNWTQCLSQRRAEERTKEGSEESYIRLGNHSVPRLIQIIKKEI